MRASETFISKNCFTQRLSKIHATLANQGTVKRRDEDALQTYILTNVYQEQNVSHLPKKHFAKNFQMQRICLATT